MQKLDSICEVLRQTQAGNATPAIPAYIKRVRHLFIESGGNAERVRRKIFSNETKPQEEQSSPALQSSALELNGNHFFVIFPWKGRQLRRS